jgi:hypothetical protein
MKTMRTSIMIAAAAVLLAAPALTPKAEAGVIVSVSGIQVGGIRAGGCVRIGRPAPLPDRHRVRHHARYQPKITLTRQDRVVAKRLAWYTGVPKRDLLDWRRDGHRWVTIGRWLGVPRPVVLAAADGHRWQRYQRRGQRAFDRIDVVQERCGTHSRSGRGRTPR